MQTLQSSKDPELLMLKIICLFAQDCRELLSASPGTKGRQCELWQQSKEQTEVLRREVGDEGHQAATGRKHKSQSRLRYIPEGRLSQYKKKTITATKERETGGDGRSLRICKVPGLSSIMSEAPWKLKTDLHSI